MVANTRLAFFELVKTFIKENEGKHSAQGDFLGSVKAASKDLQTAMMYFCKTA